jgi:uncharacterized protein with beta-barrel porin domain
MRRSLCLAYALAVTALLPLLTINAAAQTVGGNGGASSGISGAGGTSEDSEPGQNGGPALGVGGGGGGGAGTTGGAGGNGGATGGAGGAGGAGAGLAGQNGGAAGVPSFPGGGGGGGAHGATGGTSNAGDITGGAGGSGGNSLEAAGGGGGAGGYGLSLGAFGSYSNAGDIEGGQGGNGGNGSLSLPGAGGGGGQGGIGFNAFGTGTLIANLGFIQGGAGGSGGAGNAAGSAGAGGAGVVAVGVSGIINEGFIWGGQGGAGGDGSVAGNGGQGGIGILVVNPAGASITNSGLIIGGDGGPAGTGTGGSAGAGGAGIVGANLTIFNAGGIAGGCSCGGVEGDAITFTGGTNFLFFLPGSDIAGNVVINGGRLDGEVIGGPVSSSTNYIVNSGATLGGSDMPGNVIVNPGGVLSPGSIANIGALNISGDLTFLPGSLFAVRVLPGLNDSAIVSGVATLAGTVQVSAGSTNYLPSQRYTIVNALGGVSGTFSGVSTNLFFLTPSLSYDSNNVYLTLEQAIPFSAVARNGNQINVGNAMTLAAKGPIGPLGANVINTLLVQSAQSAPAVLDNISGAALSGVQTVSIETGQMASSTIADQIAFWRSGGSRDASGAASGQGPSSFIAYAPVERNIRAKGPIKIKGPTTSFSEIPQPRLFRAWSSFFGGGANFLADGGRGTPAANAGYYGGLLGVDYQIAPGVLIGAALGGSTASFSAGQFSTSGKMTGFHAGLYGSYAKGASYVSLSETFSAYSNRTNRTAGGYGFLAYEQLEASFSSTEFRTRVEGGHSLSFAGVTATPFVAAEAAAYQSGAFSERSSLLYFSSLALKNNGQSILSAGLRGLARIEWLHAGEWLENRPHGQRRLCP